MSVLYVMNTLLHEQNLQISLPCVFCKRSREKEESCPYGGFGAGCLVQKLQKSLSIVVRFTCSNSWQYSQCHHSPSPENLICLAAAVRFQSPKTKGICLVHFSLYVFLSTSPHVLAPENSLAGTILSSTFLVTGYPTHRLARETKGNLSSTFLSLDS